MVRIRILIFFYPGHPVHPVILNSSRFFSAASRHCDFALESVIALRGTIADFHFSR